MQKNKQRSLLKRGLNYLHKYIFNFITSPKYFKPQIAVELANIFVKIKKIENLNYSFNTKNNLFEVKEKNIKRFYYSQTRFFWLYGNGIIKRSSFLFRSYCLNKIKFRSNDIVIDCGANSGDLFFSLADKIKAFNYYAVEPNPQDYEILKKNLPKCKNLFNCALGEKEKKLALYISSENGDSSLIRPAFFDRKVFVPVFPLDQFVKNNKIKKIKLLKIEAEGAEPEILKGLKNSIYICEFIAIDGGYERGVEKKETFTMCTNFLLNNSFKLVDIYFPWNRALYHNCNF